MSGKEKNRLTGLDRFLRYRGNNLSGTERNAFERELQKDPFAEEAHEGMELINNDLLRGDMSTLNKRLKSRIARSSRFVLYRIAASVAVLMVVTAVYFLLQKNRPSYQERLTAGKEILTPQNYLAPPPAPPAAVDNQSKDLKDNKAEKNNEKAVAARSVTQPGDEIRIAEKEMKPEEVKETIPAVKMEAEVKSETGGEIIADLKAGAAKDSISPAVSQQNAFAAGEAAVPVTRAKSVEVIEESASAKYDMKRQVAYTNADGPAGPVIGIDSFNKYIENNIRIPSGQKENQTEVVDLAFIIRLNGIPDSVRATSSPGKPYTDEAIRLIKEGPLWKPAVEKGILTEKKVNFRIIFR